MKARINLIYKFFYFFILNFLTLSCSDTNTIEENWKGGKIKSPGIYSYKEKKVKIYLTNNDGLLNYFVVSDKKDTLIKSPYAFSNYHKWLLYWDKNDIFWVESSDIGSSVWIKDSLRNNNYREYSILNDSVPFNLIPDEIYQALPRSIKRRVDLKKNNLKM